MSAWQDRVAASIFAHREPRLPLNLALGRLGGFHYARLCAKKISYYAYRDTVTLQAGTTDTLRVALRYYHCSGY